MVGVIAFLFLYGESGLVARALQGVGLDVRWSLQGAGAILLVHAYSMYVYFYLFVRSALARFDPTLLEAASVLGASRTRTFFTVILPLLRPALAGASLLVFMTSVASFSAPYIFGGGFRVMTTQIVTSKLNGDVEMARVEAVMLALLALVGLLILRRIDPGWQLRAGGRGVAARSQARVGSLRRALLLMTGWLGALVLLLPHLTLILISFVPPNTWTVEAFPPVLDMSNYGRLISEAERLRPAVNSLWMAGVATLGALALGLFAARYAARLTGPLGRILEGLLAVPWAIPGTVFAISLATTFSVDRPLVGRVVLIGNPLAPAARLSRAQLAHHRSQLSGGASPAGSVTRGGLCVARGGSVASTHCGAAADAQADAVGGRRSRLHHHAGRLRDLDRSVHLRDETHLDRSAVESQTPGDWRCGRLRRSVDGLVRSRFSWHGAAGPPSEWQVVEC